MAKKKIVLKVKRIKRKGGKKKSGGKRPLKVFADDTRGIERLHQARATGPSVHMTSAPTHDDVPIGTGSMRLDVVLEPWQLVQNSSNAQYPFSQDGGATFARQLVANPMYCKSATKGPLLAGYTAQSAPGGAVVQLMKLFTQYAYRLVEVEYRPTVSSTASGSFAMCMRTDADASWLSSSTSAGYNDVKNSPGSITSGVARGFRYTLLKDKSLNRAASRLWYCDPTFEGYDADTPVESGFNQFNIYAATAATTTLVCGDFRVHVIVDLYGLQGASAPVQSDGKEMVARDKEFIEKMQRDAQTQKEYEERRKALEEREKKVDVKVVEDYVQVQNSSSSSSSSSVAVAKNSKRPQ